MIRTLLGSIKQDVREGALELIESWREEQNSFLWLDIQQELGDAETELLASLGCHELALQDVKRKRHPPKVEYFHHNIFILFLGIDRIEDNLRLSPQKVGFFIGERYLITVHTGHSISINHFFSEVRQPELLREPRLLASLIMHYASGRYLDTILTFEARLAEAEDKMMTDGSDELMKELVGYRSQLRKLKRIFNYHERLAQVFMTTECAEDANVAAHYRHALRDLYDRCERLNSLSGMYYEICGDLIDGYISITSHQLNNTMKILTIITAIFVPLGFLAGLYGMNFDHMPELHHPYAYYILLGVMALIATTMVTLFKRYRWF